MKEERDDFSGVRYVGEKVITDEEILDNSTHLSLYKSHADNLLDNMKEEVDYLGSTAHILSTNNETTVLNHTHQLNLNNPDLKIDNNIEDNLNTRLRADLGKTDVITTAESALGSAVCSIARCEALLMAHEQEECKKLFVAILVKLKDIKDDIGGILEDLTNVGSSITKDSVDGEDILKNDDILEDLVKAELQDEDFAAAADFIENNENEDTRDDDFIFDEELNQDQNFDDKPRPKKKRKKEKENEGEGKRKRNICYNCDTKFLSVKTLKAHRVTCDVKGDFKCPHCDRYFINEIGLNRHVGIKHGNKDCGICHQSFESRALLLQHAKDEKHYTDDLKIFCDKDECDQTFLSKRDYQRHVLVSHTDVHVCNECEQTFVTLKELNKHIRITHTKHEVVSCETCGETCEHMRDLNKHIRLYHSRPTKHSCETCNQEFETTKQLHEHMNESNHKTLICDVCSSTFLNRVSLMRHIRNKHSQNYKCSDCDQLFDGKIELNRHVRVEHVLKNKQWVCHMCGHSSKSKDNLRHHMVMHGEKKHKCKFCEKSFHLKIGLVQHIRVHTGEKPYECHVCGTAFKTIGSLKAHTLIHTGEKPFECKLCGKAFIQKSNLKTHMKSHMKGTLQIPTMMHDKEIKQDL